MTFPQRIIDQGKDLASHVFIEGVAIADLPREELIVLALVGWLNQQGIVKSELEKRFQAVSRPSQLDPIAAAEETEAILAKMTQKPKAHEPSPSAVTKPAGVTTRLDALKAFLNYRKKP